MRIRARIPLAKRRTAGGRGEDLLGLLPLGPARSGQIKNGREVLASRRVSLYHSEKGFGPLRQRPLLPAEILSMVRPRPNTVNRIRGVAPQMRDQAAYLTLGGGAGGRSPGSI